MVFRYVPILLSIPFHTGIVNLAISQYPISILPTLEKYNNILHTVHNNQRVSTTILLKLRNVHTKFKFNLAKKASARDSNLFVT